MPRLTRRKMTFRNSTRKLPRVQPKTIAAIKGMIIIHQLCGDAKFWKQVGEVLALEHGMKALGTWCIRYIEPYIKFFNAEIERVEELPDGLKRYHCRFKDTGKLATCSPNL